jgi:hypothetical protein
MSDDVRATFAAAGLKPAGPVPWGSPIPEPLHLLTLPGERRVYWAATDNFRIAEHLMLEAFAAARGRLPIANKIGAIRERAAN